MKKQLYILLIGLFISLTNSWSQNEVVQFLDLGIPNAAVLSEAYLKPYAGMLNGQLSSGWNKSPRVLRSGKITFDLFYSRSIVKTEDKQFDVSPYINSNQLQDISLKNETNSLAPTAISRYRTGMERPTFLYNNKEISTPNGTNIEHLQLPTLSLAIGTPLQADINFKLTPPTNYTSMERLRHWGTAIKYSLEPIIPALKRNPHLEAALMFEYSGISTSTEVSYYDQFPQSIDISGNSLTSRFLMGAHLYYLDIFGSIGYNSNSSSAKLIGSYEFIPNSTEISKDPLDIAYDFSTMEYEIGAQVRTIFLNAQISYTYSYYPLVSFGVGINL